MKTVTGIASGNGDGEDQTPQEREAAERLKSLKQKESFDSLNTETLDQLIAQERNAVKARYYSDTQGVQKLYLQALDFVGFGQKYRGRTILENFRGIIGKLDGVVNVLEERRDAYSKEQKQVYAQTTQDRVNFEDYKIHIGERRRLKSRYETELDTLAQESLTGSSSSVRELDLQCKLVDLENDLNILNNETNEVATRLQVADASISAYGNARKGISNLLSAMVVQRAHARGHMQKAELAYRLRSEAATESMVELYLLVAKSVKETSNHFGEGKDDSFGSLPSVGKIGPAHYGNIVSKDGNQGLELWEQYDKDKKNNKKS